MPFHITDKELACLSVDAIVNPTDVSLSLRKLSIPANSKLQAACEQLRSLRIGDIRITQAYGLPAWQIAHLILPDKVDNPDRISNYYSALFRIARQYGWRSLAVPLFPSSNQTTLSDRDVFRIAAEAFQRFSEKRDLQVYFVVDKDSLHPDEALLLRLKDYINARFSKRLHPLFMELDHGDEELSFFKKPEAFITLEPNHISSIPSNSVISAFNELDLTLDESFASAVLRLESERSMTDPQLYTRSNLSRAVFNKLKQSALRPREVVYQPSKNTALALCVGLQLSVKEAEDLLKKAGYALSHSSKGDLVVEYFLSLSCFDIFIINEALFRLDLVPLGSF